MAASHFFLGVGVGIAILTIPTLVVAPQLDLAERIGAWVAGPAPDETSRGQNANADLASLNRPLRGYAGQPTPTAEPPPTLQPRSVPRPAPRASSGGAEPDSTGAPAGGSTNARASGSTSARAGGSTNARAGGPSSAAAGRPGGGVAEGLGSGVAGPGMGAAGGSTNGATAANAVPTLPPAGLRTGVIRSGGGGAVYVRRVAGIQSPDDALLPDGSPVLVSASSEIQVSGQTWRSVRGLNGVAGWVPSSMVSVDGPGAPMALNGSQVQPPPEPQGDEPDEPEHAVVANTNGRGVVLRRSARPDDRTPAGLREGTSVAVLERSGPASGDDMAHVRADNGQEGWVPAQYLAPASF
jgi:hypothetical protein